MKCIYEFLYYYYYHLRNYFIRKCDLDVHPVVKKMCVNSDTKKSKSKRKRKKKKHVEKKDNNVSESSSYLSDIINVEEKSLNDFANDLCTNLCEYNKILMCKYPIIL